MRGGGGVPRSSGGVGAVRGGARDGVRVPGIYADLLVRERERAARARTVWADPANLGAGVLHRPTDLLDALEAGEPVVVAASQLTSRRVTIPAHLRPGSNPGAWWRITSDDVVEQAKSPAVDQPRPKCRSQPASEEDG